MESIFFIHSLGIDPSHRKRGIAQTLVKLSLEVTDPFSDVIVDIREANVSLHLVRFVLVFFSWPITCPMIVQLPWQRVRIQEKYLKTWNFKL